MKDNWLNCTLTSLLIFIDRTNECWSRHKYQYANGCFYGSIYLNLWIIVEVEMKLVPVSQFPQ